MSTSSKNASKAAISARMQAIVSGLQKHLPNGQFTLGGAPFTTSALVTLFQNVTTAMAAVTAANASARAAVASMVKAVAQAGPTYLLLKRYLLNQYGTDTSTLADFGLEPAKARTPLTSAEQAAAVAKAKSTREARGTTSKKQKLAVKGNVTGIQVTPITVTESPSPAVQTASNASSAAPSTGTSATK